MANARKPSVRGQKDDVPLLKMRISELEEQVADYKKRIEDLRKAKNTTMIKREREIIDVRAPNLGLRDSSVSDGRVADLEKQLKEMEARHLKEKEELMKKKQDGVTKNDNQDCGHELEISNLKRTLGEAQCDVMVLRIENQDLQERVEGLIMELSIKEAKWCETEESLTLKLKQEWGEKYREWMQETERKVAELQEANALLRGYLEKDRSEGPGSSERGAGSSS